jgi:DNA-binding sugar fermentation-stimulating protein
MANSKEPIYRIPDTLYEAFVLKRPSAHCKTPYVADIYIPELDLTSIAHSPSLGCCGLSDKEHKVMVCKIPETKSKKERVCEYVIMLSVIEEKGETIYVGINPKLSETIVHEVLLQNKISFIRNISNVQREKKFLNSRFDFIGKTDETDFILEVKSVPLSDYEDISEKDKKKNVCNYEELEVNNKVAYFPVGYRKKKNQLVSPRALKHIQELEEITTSEGNTTLTYLCYVIQREDANRFQTSILDPIYKEAVEKASNNGVNIIALQIKWNRNGEAYLITDRLPINL